MVLFSLPPKLPGWRQQIIEADTVQYYYGQEEYEKTDKNHPAASTDGRVFGACFQIAEAGEGPCLVLLSLVVKLQIVDIHGIPVLDAHFLQPGE